MDAVYIVRAGDNEELRYSIRSLIANVEVDQVWLFGAGPDWYAGPRVPIRQNAGKQQNVRRALIAACKHPEVSDPFLLLNDDMYALRHTVPALMDRGRLTDVLAAHSARHPKSSYTRRMTDTLAFLKAQGFSDPRSFELHVPLPVRKSVMLAALQLIGSRELQWRSVYGALIEESSESLDDVKVCTVHDEPDFSRVWLSSGDSTFSLIRERLHALFPERSGFEAETMKVEVLKRFRDVQAGMHREKGEVFETTAERFASLNSTKYGQLVRAISEPVETPEGPLTVPRIKEMLKARGVEFRSDARKNELLELLDA